MLLYLKNLCKHIEYGKMETIWAAILIMTPGFHMESIDPKDLYYCVPVSKGPIPKYLKFHHIVSTLMG